MTCKQHEKKNIYWDNLSKDQYLLGHNLENQNPLHLIRIVIVLVTAHFNIGPESQLNWILFYCERLNLIHFIVSNNFCDISICFLSEWQ